VLASNASTLFREFTATPLSKTAPPKLMIAPSLTAEAFQSTVTVPAAKEADGRMRTRHSTRAAAVRERIVGG
jgi:hypothetical protein